jgi:hypothetical protein
MIAAPVSDFARAGFVDDAEDLAGCDREEDVVERQQLPAAGRELDAEMVDLEERRRHRSSRAAECSRRPALRSRLGP